jgi:pyruvate/2-oxoacid:ferredoxin oxidoreductase alpha subunit/NAD-dependent dihydropyrimidine dehydrogenase PreA subunit
MTTAATARRLPEFHPESCKGCLRCAEACAKDCLTPGTEIDARSGLVPVKLDLARCNGCGLCIAACPEPHALEWHSDPAVRPPRAPDVPDQRVALPPSAPMFVKGMHASATGAILAGCRHFFGYPITPSTEGAELMSAILPSLGGTFVQAMSEVAAINMMFGCGGAGLRSLTFTSSPGFSLMLEGLSYCVGAEVPCVVMDVMRAGPGLGNVGPEQADVKLACRGLGHGNTHAVVLAPATTQEMLDFTFLAFDLAMRWRNPVVIVVDGHVAQMTGKVVLPAELVRPGLPAWAVYGDAGHRDNLISSIQLREADQEAHNVRLVEKYAAITAVEQRAEVTRCDDAEVVIVAANGPARTALGALESLRAEGIPVGLFRPQTLWPFPVKALLPALSRARRIVVVEASDGHLEDELRLALSHAGAGQGIAIDHVRRYGGILPSRREIVEAVRRGTAKAVAA